MIFDIYYAGDEQYKQLYKYPFTNKNGLGRYKVFEKLKKDIDERTNVNEKDIMRIVFIILIIIKKRLLPNNRSR